MRATRKLKQGDVILMQLNEKKYITLEFDGPDAYDVEFVYGDLDYFSSNGAADQTEKDIIATGISGYAEIENSYTLNDTDFKICNSL